MAVASLLTKRKCKHSAIAKYLKNRHLREILELWPGNFTERAENHLVRKWPGAFTLDRPHA
jgi:hypothetical protein